MILTEEQGQIINYIKQLWEEPSSTEQTILIDSVAGS